MKKIFIFSILACLTISLFSQAPATSKWRVLSSGFYNSNLPLGTEKPFNNNTLPSDTLKSGDSLFYVFPYSNAGLAKEAVTISLFQKFKLVAADSAITITFWQSQDEVKWDTLKAGTSPVAYTKSVAKTTSYYANWNGFIDKNTYYNGNYLAIRYRAAVKSGFKTIPYGIVSTIKN